MTQNMGSLDRVLRATVGVVLGLLVAIGTVSGGWALGFGLLSVILLGTSAVGVCPGYLPFGLSTCRTELGGRPTRQG